MRWGVKEKGQQRIGFVIRAASGKETMTALCEEFQISRPTGYLWLRRYREGGQSLAAVVEVSRRPKSSPRRTAATIEGKVLKLRQEQGWGAKAIRHVLQRDEGIRLARMTVHRILERNGQIRDEDRHPPATKRFQRERPNELWQMDFKGQFRMGNRHCFPLSILDDHSRYLIGLQALEGTSADGVERTLVKTFTQYGVPDAMLMDHGTPWWDAINGYGLTRFAVSLIQQGIRLYYSGVRHPQTQGKVEKFHDTLRRAVEHRNCWPEDLRGWQNQFNAFRQTYNHRRPHEALDMNVPASRYQASLRKYQPKPKEWEYPKGSLVRRLNDQGQFYWEKRYRFVSRSLANERICIERLDQKLVIRYRHMWIREIDLLSGHSVGLVVPAESPAQTDAVVENHKTGFPQQLESSIHSSHRLNHCKECPGTPRKGCLGT
jgi:transposase InsO family protein